MLTIPTKGMSRSVGCHNVDLDVLCDWIEGSLLLLEDDEIPDSDVHEILLESGIYTGQDLAWGIVADAWSELRRRQGWIREHSPIAFVGRRIKRLRPWREVPAHSFCLALTLAKYYPKWARGFGKNYTEQGELFEQVTKSALEALLPGWRIHSTGWTRTNAKKLKDVVDEVWGHLREPSIDDLSLLAGEEANEAGLDILCYRPFPDERTGIPVFLLQCASGAHWEDKVRTPPLSLWTKIVRFSSPRKAFAIPFALLDREFSNKSVLVEGMLMDRYRLLSAALHDPDWVPPQLRARLVNWLTPRIKELPREN